MQRMHQLQYFLNSMIIYLIEYRNNNSELGIEKKSKDVREIENVEKIEKIRQNVINQEFENV